MSYKKNIQKQMGEHLKQAMEQRDLHAIALEEDEQDIRDIVELMGTLGMEVPVPDPFPGSRRRPVTEEVARDWLLANKNKDWTVLELALLLGISSPTAAELTRTFHKKGMIAERASGVYGYRKPAGRTLARPRTSPPPSDCPHGPSPPVRGAPIARTGNNGNNYPDHVRRIKTHLRQGVRIVRKGNEHIWFYLGKKHTWTSHSPKNKDDEYDQLVRRLKTEGMWVD